MNDMILCHGQVCSKKNVFDFEILKVLMKKGVISYECMDSLILYQGTTRMSLGDKIGLIYFMKLLHLT